MTLQLPDILKAVGPNASIIFAAWIFMGFLQQRYDGAISRYLQSVEDFRSNDHDGDRAGNLKNEILSYHYRCKLMGRATLSGLLAAILLISALLFGALDVLVPKNAGITVAGTVCTMVGFLLVIVAAVFVIVEGGVVNAQLNDELRDLPELADEAKQRGQNLER